MLQNGDKIGSYRILDCIGEGGMNIVYRAINDKAGKMWAVKECKKGNVDKYGMKAEDFLEIEIELLKNLRHENLPSIVDVFDEDSLIIVMDYIEGFTLSEFLSRNKRASEEDVVKWGLQLCNVLEYFHRQNPPIIYRDMKPENVMLKPDGNVVLIDFGTSRQFKTDARVNDTTMLGTKGYASPEAYGGKGQTDARSDVYSLGATLYHLITGVSPAEPPYMDAPIQQFVPSLSPGLNNVIHKCIEQNPNKRYQSCAELHYALSHYKEQDATYKKKLKHKLLMFYSLVLMFVVSLSASFICLAKGKHLKESTYDSYVEDAVLAQSLEDQLASYEMAIQIEPENDKAYNGILDLFMQDNILTSNEDTYLRELFAREYNGKTLDEWFSTNTAQYSEFSYNLAMDYWYYYGIVTENDSIEMSRESQVACRWFNKVSLYDENSESCKVHYTNARIYSQIGSYYSNIGLTNLAGDTEVSFSTYYKDLVALYRSGGDTEITGLYLKKEIIYQIIEHSNDYRSEDIPKDELLELLDAISDEIHVSKDDSLAAKLSGDIAASIELARKSVTSAYAH